MNDRIGVSVTPGRAAWVRLLRLLAALAVLGAATTSGVLELGATPAGATPPAPTWQTGQYFVAIQNVPFCDDVAVSNPAALPLTGMTAGAVPSGFTNYTIKNVDLAAGTAQICGTDTNAPVSSGTPPNLAPVATNAGGSATDNIPIASYGSCTWTTSKGTTQLFDANQDLYQTGTQSAFGAAISNGETLGSTSNYANCTDAMVAENGSGESGGAGDAYTVNTANPLPTPVDTNPSASQGDLASSNLFLNSGGCYGAVNLFQSYTYSNFGSGTSLTTPSPWVNGGTCKYGSLGSNQAGGNTDSFATCPPTQADVNAGLVSCTIIASSGNNFNGSINYTTDDLFYTGQPVPQQSTASLSTSVSSPGGTVSVTGGTNWWGSATGAPNAGPYGDAQNGAGTFYQVGAPGVYIGTTRANAVPVASSTVTISPDSYVCTGAESATVGPNPCTFTAGTPSGSFQVPSGLAPGHYNVYVDETNTSPLPGNGPNDSFQTLRGTSLGTAESVTPLVIGTAPSITSSPAATFTSGSAGTFTVTTAGTPASALSETGALPTGVSFVDNGDGTATLSGTPGAGTGGSYTFTVKASNGVSPDASQSFTLTVDAAPAITSSASATFAEGASGSFAVTSSATPTAALSETGALPSGVSLTDNGNGTATLAGTPAAGTRGTYHVTIRATNGISPDATQSFTLTVDAAPSITSSPAATFTAGSAGTFTVTTAGNPASALSETGALPTGVSFVDNGDGTATLSGTPGAGTGGSYTFTVKASNGVSPDASQSFTLTVDQAPAVTSASQTTFTAGSAGTFTVASGGDPTAALSETGALPTGVTFVDNGDGTATLAGTPAAGTRGSYPLTITASNGVSPDGSQAFTLVVDEAPAITSPTSATFTAGSAGTFTVTATGNPTATLTKSGNLPTGVTFTDNGNGTATLAGTPAAGTGGSYPVTVRAANGVSPNASQSFTLTVDQAPAVTSAAGTTFTEGVSSNFRVTTTGLPTAGLVETGALPGGVVFHDNGDGTASLSGTPTASGNFPLTITASNGVSPDATQSFALTVTSVAQAPAVTSSAATTFTEGSAGTFSVTASGKPTPAVAETGPLPSGVTFTDNGNGTATLAGTPTASGSFPITVTATNGVNPPASQSFSLTVEAAPAITSAAATTFTEGSVGTFSVTATGYPVPTLSKIGALPSGVSFTDNGNGTATLAGTPAAGTRGTYAVTVKAVNGVGAGVSQSFTLTVHAAPSITSAGTATFTVGSSGSFTVTSTGAPTATLAESGPLPGGVSFAPHVNGTATLSGTPASGTGGSYPITVTASNGVSPDATQSFVLTVDQAPSVTSTNTTTFSEGSAGSFTVTTAGSPAPTLSLSGGLPSGVTFLDEGNGTATLAGTPGVGTGGSYPVTLTAANGVGPNATQAFTLSVDAAPAVTSAPAATFTAGSGNSFAVTTNGRPTATLTETGALPAGVSFVDNGNGTASLSGTPAAGTGGVYPVTITAANGVGPGASQSFTLTVVQAPAITSANHAMFAAGSSNTFAVATTGYPTASLHETGALPAGVTFVDHGNGSATLAGAPTGGGSFPVTITASNGVAPNATQAFTLTVGTPPAFTSADHAAFPLGSPGSFTVSATGNPAPTITASGSLPRGISFAGGTLSGTPTQPGTFQIGFVANNGVGPQAVQYFTLTVTGLQVTTTSLPPATASSPYSVQLAASGGIAPLKWAKTTTLPRGLKLGRTGLLSGTVSAKVAAGSYTISIKVTDADRPKQTATATFVLTVNG